MNARFEIPTPKNEPVLTYAPEAPERAQLKATLETMSKEVADIAAVVDGRPVRTGRTTEVRAPHDQALVVGRVHEAGTAEVEAAVQAARRAAPEWAAMAYPDRLAIFLRAAELLATKYRPILNAATMLGQSKTAHQAEIDAACETIDFWRWNAHFAERLYAEQPYSPAGSWNRMEMRPLEGFVYAVTPFNFTAIGANLPTAPAMMGNTVLWKPAATAALSAHYVMQLLIEAGLPPGVINLISGRSAEISEQVMRQPDFAGLHFTGSTSVFQTLWRTAAENLPHYRSYPRLVGETGGKDFIVAHPSADVEALAVAIVRGGFEYQGQKCSAASRIYLPDSLWRGGLKERLAALIGEIAVGDVRDFRNFMGAVIDQRAYQRISAYVKEASSSLRILAGGRIESVDKSGGFFIPPTLVESEDPKSRLMTEEIFGPVVTVHVYPEARYSETLRLVDESSPYALTGAVFARDRKAIVEAERTLVQAAGNFYINDKPTGAVVGQQPFGGARASGTNDKAGSLWNLIRWVSPRTIKETFVPPTNLRYPFMQER